ncbi:MAG: hypothetical protein WD271_05925 [Acidimicrobiia bacterium]
MTRVDVAIESAIEPPRRGARERAPLTLWAVLVLAGALLVRQFVDPVAIARHDAVPLHASFDPHIEIAVVLPLAIALALIVWGARLAATLEWRRLLAGAWVASTSWAIGLAAVRGWGRITAPLEHSGEYLALLPGIHSIPSFLDGFVENIRHYPVHVQGHPPGFATLSASLHAGGLGSPVLVALLCIVVGAAAAPLVLVVVREVVDEEWARRSALFVVLAPMSIWIATSADAFYAGVSCAATALVVLATGRQGSRGDAYAVGGGILFGVLAYLSYGLVLVAVIPLTVAVYRRAPRPVLLACAGALPVVGAFLLSGFWWIDGLLATRDRYFAGVASRRPYPVFLVANLASFAIVLGPAAFVALTRLRHRRVWLLVASALAAVALADLSGMSKGEVERIWLPFAPFVLVSCGALWSARVTNGTRDRRFSTGTMWLAAQAGLAVGLEGLVRTAW